MCIRDRDSPDFAAGDEARERAELEKSISIASSEDISDSKGKLEFVSEEEELARNNRISERMKTEVPEAGERAREASRGAEEKS